METQEKYLVQLDNTKIDLRQLQGELDSVIRSFECGDIEYAYERAFEHLVDKAQQVRESLRLSRRFMRDVAEELAELEELSQWPKKNKNNNRLSCPYSNSSRKMFVNLTATVTTTNAIPQEVPTLQTWNIAHHKGDVEGLVSLQRFPEMDQNAGMDTESL